MKNSIKVENIKCGGCSNSIKKELTKIEGISEIIVDVENGNIEYVAEKDFDVSVLINKLAKMGYPQIGEGSIISAAKSYVSCMIGRTMAPQK